MASLPNLSSLRLEGAGGSNGRGLPHAPPLTGAGVEDIFESYRQLQDANARKNVATEISNQFREGSGLEKKIKTNLEAASKQEGNAANLRVLKFAVQIYELRPVTAGDNRVDDFLRVAVNAKRSKAKLLTERISVFIVQQLDDDIQAAVGGEEFYETEEAKEIKELLARYLAERFVNSRPDKEGPIYEIIAGYHADLLKTVKGDSEVLQATSHQKEMMRKSKEFEEWMDMVKEMGYDSDKIRYMDLDFFKVGGGADGGGNGEGAS